MASFWQAVPRRIRAFSRDTSGYVTLLMMVLFTGILMLTGIAIDLLKHESERADLQAALDRGVLAATTLTQESDVNAVVESYVRNGLSFGQEVDLTVVPNLSKNNRSIRAVAQYRSPSIFLSMIGMNELIVPAQATATQRQNEIEISLILDRSGSMGSWTKIGRLITAGQRFVDIIEDSYAADDSATINLVPYAGSVATDQAIAALFQPQSPTYDRRCLSFPTTAFATTDFTTGDATQPFSSWTCPDSRSHVAFLSNNYSNLRSRIGQLRAGGTTGTYTAMKWGLALLSPALRTDRIFTIPGGTGGQVTMTDYLLANGLMPIAHANRPFDWTERDASKVIVLMTDGFIYPPWFQSGWREVNTNTGVQRFLQLCQLAQDRGVIVYTIAFQTSGAAVDQMRTCASSDSTFFDVDGTDLVAAFEAIAKDISKLRLIE